MMSSRDKTLRRTLRYDTAVASPVNSFELAMCVSVCNMHDGKTHNAELKSVMHAVRSSEMGSRHVHSGATLSAVRSTMACVWSIWNSA